MLFEKSRRGLPMHGFTDNYIRAELPSEVASDDYDNKIIKVRLGNFNSDGSALIAEIID